MYLNHYRLKTKPFDLSPGPDFIWLGEKHEEALSTLSYGISENLGFLLLTGDVGAGKTALIHRLASSLEPSIIVAHITDPGVGVFDFFKLLAAEFNLSQAFHGKADFLLELEKFLLQAYLDHKKVLLIVDEAQRLSNKLLDEIRVLSNIELSHRKLINIFFVGQPEFKKMLLGDANRAIRQRIAVNYHIQPLTASETGQYIEHRLKVAGGTRTLFSPNAVREVFRFSNGYPRAINMICDHALLTGYAAGKHAIDAEMVRECQRELAIRAGSPVQPSDFQPASVAATRSETPPPPPPPPSRRPVPMGYAILIGVLIISFSAVGYFYLRAEPRWTIPSLARNNLTASSDLGAETVDQVPAPDRRILPVPAPETAPTGLDPVFGDLESVGPQAETAVADRTLESISRPAIPAIEPIAEQPPAAEDVSVYDQAERDLSALLAALNAHSEAQPDQADGPTAVGPDSAPDRHETIETARLPAAGADAAEPATEPQTVQAAAAPAVTPSAVIASEPAPEKERKPPAPVSAEPDPPDQSAASVGESTMPSPPAEPKEPSQTLIAAVEPQAQPEVTPEPHLSDSRPEPPAAAPPPSQLQAAIGVQAAQGAAEEKPAGLALEDRLRQFLDNYSSTYASKDLGAFTDLFSPDAKENGQPFESLVPVYERNFTVIETINYRIELQQYAYDDRGEFVEIKGDFFLRWLPPDQRWRENSGKISMRLKAVGPSFVVQRLDYHGHGSQ